MRRTLSVASVALFLTSVYRAATFPFVHDESLTFNGLTWQSQYLLLANNHPLNTRLMRIAHLVLGDTPLALRVPILLAHALYLTCVVLLLLRYESRAVQLGGFVLLAMNPFMLDYFFLARGYGFGLAFEMLSLLLLAWRKVYLSLAAAALAVIAHLTFFNFFVPLLAIALWMVRRDRMVRLIPLLAGSLTLVSFVLGTGIQLQMRGELYWGGHQSFLHDTARSFVESLLYHAPIPVMPLVFALAAGLVLMLVRKREPFVLLLAGAIVMPIAMHFVAGTLLPLERATLFYVPLYGLALLEIAPRIVPALAILALAHFAWTYNPRTCFTWGYDAHDVEVLERIDRDRGGRNVLLGISWQFEPSLNFYRRTRHYTWLAPLTRYEVRLDGDYEYAFESDVDASRGTVLARYPDTKTILLRLTRGARRATPPLPPRSSY